VTTVPVARSACLLSPGRRHLFNANIYTGVVDTSSFHGHPAREAVAVRDGRVEAVGRNDEIGKLKGPSTEVINLAGIS